MKADKAFERGGIFVVNTQWFHESVARWERQPETKFLIPRRHHRKLEANTSAPSTGRPLDEQQAAGTMPIVKRVNDINEVKVSALDGVGENGISSRASATEELVNTTPEESSALPSTEGSNLLEVSQESNDMDLQVDWDAIDKEVADALASDDDDDDSVAESEGVNGEPR